jgi:TonB-dependent receptor
MTTREIEASRSKLVFKKSTLAVCIAALTAAQAYGQNTTTEEPTALEEVVVYGIKQSLQNAQDIKRDAATVKDVVTASDIGALPDKSVVEAISRVPGVAIERFAASDDPDHFSVEGSGAVVRGLNRVRSEFNGRDTFSATRSSGLNFSDVPAELMGGVEVVKNLTADMVEGGVAGTINLITRKPFDSEGMQAGGTVKYTYGDRIGEGNPDFSGIFSNRWDTDIGEFGFLINASVSTFAAQSEGVQLFPWYERSTRGYVYDENGNAVLEPCPAWAYPDNCLDTNDDGVLDSFPWGSFPNAVDNSLGIGRPLAGADPNAIYTLPAAVALRLQENERDRTGIATSLQWANPSDTVLVTAEFIRSKSELAWNERFIEYADEPFDPVTWNRFGFQEDPENPARSSFDYSFDSTGRFTHGILSGVPYVSGSRLRKETSTINDASLNIVLKPNDNLKVTADLQYIKAEASIYDFTIHGISSTEMDNALLPSVYVDLRGSVPFVEFMSPTGYADSFSNPGYTILRSAMDHISDNDGDAIAFASDVEYSFDEGWISSIKGGFRISDKTQERRESDYNWGNISQEWADNRESFGENPEFGELFTFDSDFSNGSALGGNRTFWFPKADMLHSPQVFFDRIWDNSSGDRIHAEGGADMWYPLTDPRRNLGAPENNPIPGTPFLPSEIFEINEKRNAVYAMLNFANEDFSIPVRGNFGIRYVSYDLESNGSFVVEPVPAEYLVSDNWAGGSVEIPAEDIALLEATSAGRETIKSDFDKILPSFNIGLEVTEDIIVRFAASQSIWLPDLENARYNYVLSKQVQVSEARPDTEGPDYANYEGFYYKASDVGNPLLQPEVATNLDLTAEWYFADVGSLTLSLFHKNIEDLHRRVAVLSTYNDKPFVYSTIDNVGEATIKGFEVAYQQTFDFFPEPFNGIGVQANYTYIDAEQKASNVAAGDAADQVFRWFDNLPLEGLSKDTANFVLFYENDLFSTRLAYNWRSKYLLNSRDVISYSPIYNMSGGQLDFSFRYNIADNLKLGFEANNLTDEVTETHIQFNQAGVLTPRSYFMNDRRYTLVLSASF